MKATIYGRPGCTFCIQAKALAANHGIEVDYKIVGEDILKEQLEEMIGHSIKSVPQIFINADGFNEYVGGYTELKARLDGSVQ